METKLATDFVVVVINEGGCIMPEMGDSYNSLEESVKAAKKITQKQCRDAGAFNMAGQCGVNVQIIACDEESEIASDSVNGGMVIWDKFV